MSTRVTPNWRCSHRAARSQWRSVLRCRVGGQVTLQLNGWDQYNRPCQVNLAELNWQCKGASINSQTLVFSAPRRPGHYYIRVRVPGGPKTAWAWADVYVHR